MKFDLANAKEVLKWRIAKANSSSSSGSTGKCKVYKIECKEINAIFYSLLEPKTDSNGYVYFDTKDIGGGSGYDSGSIFNPTTHPYSNSSILKYDGLILNYTADYNESNIDKYQLSSNSGSCYLGSLQFCNQCTESGSSTAYYLEYDSSSMYKFIYDGTTAEIYYSITFQNSDNTSSTTLYFDTDTSSKWTMNTNYYIGSGGEEQLSTENTSIDFYYPINWLMGSNGWYDSSDSGSGSGSGTSASRALLKYKTLGGSSSYYGIYPYDGSSNLDSTTLSSKQPYWDYNNITLTTDIKSSGSSSSGTVGKRLYKLDCTVTTSGSTTFSLYSLIEPKTDSNGRVYFADDNDSKKWTSDNEVFDPSRGSHPYPNDNNNSYSYDGIILTAYSDNDKFVTATSGTTREYGEIDLRLLRYNSSYAYTISDSGSGETYSHPYLRYDQYSGSGEGCYFTYDNKTELYFYYSISSHGPGSTAGTVYFAQNDPDIWDFESGMDPYSTYGYVAKEWNSASQNFYFPVNYRMSSQGFGNFSTYPGGSDTDTRANITIAHTTINYENTVYYLICSESGNNDDPVQTTGGDWTEWNIDPILTKYVEDSSDSSSGTTEELVNNVYLNDKYELFCNVKTTADVSEASDTVSGTVKGYTSSNMGTGVYLNNNVLTLDNAGENQFGGVKLANKIEVIDKTKSVEYYIYSSCCKTPNNSAIWSFSSINEKHIFYYIVDKPYDVITDMSTGGGGVFGWKTLPTVYGVIVFTYSSSALTFPFVDTCFFNSNGLSEGTGWKSSTSLEDSSYYVISNAYITNLWNTESIYTMSSSYFIRSSNVHEKILSALNVTKLNFPDIAFLNNSDDGKDVAFNIGLFNAVNGPSGTDIYFNSSMYSIMPEIDESTGYITDDYTTTKDTSCTYANTTKPEEEIIDNGSATTEWPLFNGKYISVESIRNKTNADFRYTSLGSISNLTSYSYNSDGKQYIQSDGNYPYTDLNNYYTKDEADTKADTKLASYYTKTETDTKTDTKLASYYTKTETDTKLASYYTKDEIDNKTSSESGSSGDCYTKTETDTKFANYYTKDEIGDLTKDLASLFEEKLNS